MASACVNSGWLSPRISFSRDDDAPATPSPAVCDTQFDSPSDFEFRLGDDPVAMLPADELFSGGKLVPTFKTAMETTPLRRTVPPDVSVSPDCDVFSPKAPTCTGRWKELIKFRKLTPANHCSTPLRNLLHRRSGSAAGFPEDNVHSPLLKGVPEDHPRLSLDLEKPCLSPNPFMRNPSSNPGQIRTPRKSAGVEELQSARAAPIAMESPRMNASGKIIFQTLERSSSSPSSFNGGSRVKHKGMERRSYSATVRVLNVPVKGWGTIFASSPQKNGGKTAINGRCRA